MELGAGRRNWGYKLHDITAVLQPTPALQRRRTQALVRPLIETLI